MEDWKLTARVVVQLETMTNETYVWYCKRRDDTDTMVVSK